MDKNTNQEKLTMHYCRYRRRGEPEWFDPATDIRKIIPGVMLAVLMGLEDKMQSKPDVLKDIQYIHECIRVFQIRVLEDPAPLASQLKTFFGVLGKVPSATANLWFKDVVCTLMCMYGLLCRRDSATDNSALRSMLEYSRLTLLENVLKPETLEEVRRELREAGVPLLVQSNTTSEDMAQCIEDPSEVFENLKQTACRYLNFTTQNADWDVMSELCDQALSTSDIKSEETEVALALAYPSYKGNRLVVEVTRDDNSSETTEVAPVGQPRSV